MQKTISIRTRTGILSQPVYETIYVGDSDAYELKIELANLTTIPGTVILRFVRADEAVIEQISSNISGNVITHVLTEQQTAVAGELKMYIRIVEGTTELYTTTLITFPAVTALAGGNVIPSEEDINIVAQIVGAEALRVAAEQGRVEAEDLRAYFEVGRIANEEERVDNENIRIPAENTRISNESARVTAELSRATAESARVGAESARNVWEAYNPATAYAVGNKVYYLGSSYICHTASTGHLPTDSGYWSIIVQKGDKGDQGIPGGDITTASELPIVDSGAYFTATDVEGALQEVASDLASLNIDKALSELTDVTLTTPSANQLLTYNGTTSTWINQDAPSGGQYLGTATTKAIAYNAQTISENITIPANYNAMSVGKITIADGYKVTVEDGGKWVIL